MCDEPLDMNTPLNNDKPTLTINLNEQQTNQIIYLTDDNNSWITVTQLPTELIDYTNTNYEKLFTLHPPELGKILYYNHKQNNDDPLWNEVIKNRYHASYLNTPKYSEKVLASFMFSGYDESKNNDDLPNEFKPYYNFIKSLDNNYNQVGINWYDDGFSYIPFHSDCEAGMIDKHAITIINLNNPNQLNDNSVKRQLTLAVKYEERILTFKPRQHDNNSNLFNNVHIVLSQGAVISMHGDTQKCYKHGIKPLKNNNAVSRIGISFRQF